MSLTPEQFKAIGNAPAHAPPPGVQSNFVDPYDLMHVDYAVMAVSVALPTIVIGLRLYSKIAIIRKLGIDDCVLVLGWALYVVYCAYTAVMARAHIGRHQWDVQLKDLKDILYGTHVASILYGITTTLIKTSILLQYLDIFSPPGNRGFMFWSCWSLIGVLVAFYTAATFAEIFTCTPTHKFWNPLTVAGHCINYLALNVAAGAVNSAADLIIIVLPQRAVWRLNMSTAHKWRASSIFLIALFALVASVIRLYYAVELMLATDATWNTNMMGLWTFAEFVTTIICSCLPSLARLAKVWTPSLVSFGKKLTSYGTSRRSQTLTDSGGRTQMVSSNGKGHVYVMKSVHSNPSSVSMAVHRPLASYSDEESLTREMRR